MGQSPKQITTPSILVNGQCQTVLKRQRRKPCTDCTKRDYISANTYKIPKQQSEPWNAELPCANPIGKNWFYPLISTEHRNWVKTIKTTKSDLEIANTREPAQHRILQIYIQISLKTNNANIQSNNTIPYNIKALRKEPQNADENSLILKTIWPYTQPPKRYCVGNS